MGSRGRRRWTVGLGALALVLAALSLMTAAGAITLPTLPPVPPLVRAARRRQPRVLKVRQGLIQEVGIANRSLTAGAGAARRCWPA